MGGFVCLLQISNWLIGKIVQEQLLVDKTFPNGETSVKIQDVAVKFLKKDIFTQVEVYGTGIGQSQVVWQSDGFDRIVDGGYSVNFIRQRLQSLLATNNRDAFQTVVDEITSKSGF